MYRTNAAASRLEGEWGKCTSAEGSAVRLTATFSYRGSKSCFVSSVHRRPGDSWQRRRAYTSHRLIIPNVMSLKKNIQLTRLLHTLLARMLITKYGLASKSVVKSRYRFCNLHKLLHAKITACICVDITDNYFSKFQSTAGLHLPELCRLTLQRYPCMSL